VTLSLPARTGPRPTTAGPIPHRQVDQNPPPALYATLLERFFETPGTTHGPSLISVPGAQALFLDGCDGHPADCFLRGSEFAHVHPPSDGSFHMVLSPEDCAHVLQQGWGELHPLAIAGQIPASVLMVYAPRTEAEVLSAMSIVAASKRNAEAKVRAAR
jgi:hypothetical protein